MAIQGRRGIFADLKQDKLVGGEWAVVTSGDPNSESGRAIYLCFEPGVVKRMATYEDMVENISLATEEVQAMFTADVLATIQAATQATADANSAIIGANTATSNANLAADRAEAIYELLKDVDVGNLTLRIVNLEETAITLETPIPFSDEDGDTLPQLFEAQADTNKALAADALKVEMFSATVASMSAGVVYTVEIPVTGLNGKQLLYAIPFANGGTPMAVSFNGLNNERVSAYARCETNVTNRIIRALVFYK